MSGHQNGEPSAASRMVLRVEGGSKAGPSVAISVLQAGGQVASADLTTSRTGHTLSFADGRYVAALRLRDTEAKNYYSRLSVLRGDTALASAEIFVNHPLHYGGYTFYQANFDPDNLRYSGIEVVRDPGLWVVYFGLVGMLAGVAHIFYLRTLSRRRVEVRHT